VFTPCRLGRRSPPLRGNVRVGPTAMSFVHSKYFSDSISLVVEILLQPDESLKAEQAGAFFSSESGEKKRTGRVGQSVPSNCRNANHLTDGSA